MHHQIAVVDLVDALATTGVLEIPTSGQIETAAAILPDSLVFT